MKNRLLISVVATLSCVAVLFAETSQVRPTDNGWLIGETATQKFGFHGATPTVQRAGAAQAALTDSTGGTASTTLAATTGITTITIPLTSLATGLSTSAIDLLTNYTPGYAFKILKVDWVTTVAGTGSSASQVFNLEIGTTNLTGGVVTATLASTATIGSITAGTAVTANNTGTASDNFSIEMAAGGTVFTAGAGYFVIEIQNLDTVNTAASITRLLNEIRAADVEKGLIKGSS
jgi:hypothetical protein